MRIMVTGAGAGLLSFALLVGNSFAGGEAKSADDPADVQAAIEGEEAPESAVSSPPMEMDDPGTPGAMGVEVNFVGSLTKAGEGQDTESLLDANFGIGDRIQLKYERPYVTTRSAAGAASQKGLGATELGVKWRFVDRKGLQIAAYPQYSFDDAFTVKDEEGNPEPSEGTSTYLPLLISQSVARVYTLALNLGYRWRSDSSLDDTVVALGIGRSLGYAGRILAEAYSERDKDFNNRQTDLRVGVVELLFPKHFESSGYEFPIYASIGRSVGKLEEGEPVTSFTFGVSVIKLPRGE